MIKSSGSTSKRKKYKNHGIMRINKYLSSCGICSRREADRLISDGRVTIDGRPARPGDQAEKGMTVCLDGKPVEPLAQKTYLAFYKPRGIVCTASRKEPDNIIDYLNYPVRLTYAGRLDKWSEGLILMTDDGELIDRIMSAGDFHEKEYEVTVNEQVRPEDLARMERGVYLPDLNRTTRPFRARMLDDHRFRIILTEGMNREIRRICDRYGYRISKLKRVRVMNILLGSLRPGEYRKLTAGEIRELKDRSERSGSLKNGRNRES
jgi:23S rRNA pseudouridine2604 synthase